MDQRRRARRAYTLLELLIVLAILGLLASIVVTNMLPALQKAKLTRAITDLRTLEKRIATFEIDHDALPDSLSEVDADDLRDPWGRPYRYLRIRGGSAPRGKWRKDRFLVPINSDYDLYSVGLDGETRTSLVPPISHDDVIRAGSGAYVGLARDY